MENKVLNKTPLDTDVATILARLDRSTPDALLTSIAGELLRLHQAFLVVTARMHALEVTQTIHDQIVASRETKAFASMPLAVVVDAAFSLSVENGFYHLEYDELGAPFRWTGPEPIFFFEVLVSREAPATLRMHYSQIYSPEVDDTVQCYVDGTEIETWLVEIDGEFEVHGVLPARDLVGGTVVSFVAPRVASPAIFEQSQDTRKLGLAFRWLRIDPESGVTASQTKAGRKQTPGGKSRRRGRSADEKS